jgi:hypothetical protein
MLASPSAWACSSCIDPKDQRQSGYLGPTIFMSFLPLTMIGLIGGFMWWANRRAAQAAVASLDPDSPELGPAGVGSTS